jgi:membrane fusion protein (multidrug efflux system)
LKIQGISQQDYDMSLLQVNNIMADINVLRAQQGVIKANMTKLNVYAPYSGKLGLKQVSPGAFVTPASIITTISQVNQLKIQFNIPEKYSAQVKKDRQLILQLMVSINHSPQLYLQPKMLWKPIPEVWL